MSTIIEAESKEYGKLTFALQQYQVGLYVCVYKEGRMLEQFGCDETVEKFIRRLKRCKDLIIKETKPESKLTKEIIEALK